MRGYKQPETRIRKVEDGWGVKFYPEYKLVLIPYVLWGWEPILGKIDNPDYTLTCYEAEWRIDVFLSNQAHRYFLDKEDRTKKKVKKRTTIIKYP